jgi:hypothetical protein
MVIANVFAGDIKPSVPCFILQNENEGLPGGKESLARDMLSGIF